MTDRAPGDIYTKIDFLTKAIDAASDEEKLAQLHVERGHAYEIAGDDLSSIHDFLKALEIAHGNSILVHIKSMISLTLAKRVDGKDQAAYWAMNAVDQDISDPEGWNTLGLVCHICDFLNLAILSLKKVAELEPSRWDSILALGRCLRENGNFPEAIKAMEGYVANNPNEPRGFFELAWSLQLRACSRDDLKSAREIYEKALDRNPLPSLRARIERKLLEIENSAL